MPDDWLFERPKGFHRRGSHRALAVAELESARADLKKALVKARRAHIHAVAFADASETIEDMGTETEGLVDAIELALRHLKDALKP